MFKLILFFGSLIFSISASAQILGPSCITGSNVNALTDSPIVMVQIGDRYASLGLTCEDTKNFFKATEAVNMVLLPAAMVLRTPGVRESIIAELATMGLTFANPVVLGVTVLGSVGYVTIYFVLKAKLEDCENVRFQEALKREVEDRIAVKYRKAIEVRRGP